MIKNRKFFFLCIFSLLIFMLDIAYAIFALTNFIAVNNGTKLLAQNFYSFSLIVVIFNAILLASTIMYPILKFLINYFEYNKISKKKDKIN